MEPEVVNIVGTITYQQELDLAALAETLSKHEGITSVTYKPSENHWLQTRFAPDDTYIAFYRSGRCSVVGCKSIEDFEIVVQRVNSVMRNLLDFDYNPKVEISNIVATMDLDTPISLEALTVELGLEGVEYEPEQFPALMYRDSNYVILVFSTGKLLCTGLTDLDAVSEAVDDIVGHIQAVV
jgi:transcription initiation factor TFIID TATA-box-binding protein